eukprot:scaffold210968_cov19-Prasinocladus_malaysianus.AAC.1
MDTSFESAIKVYDQGYDGNTINIIAFTGLRPEAALPELLHYKRAVLIDHSCPFSRPKGCINSITSLYLLAVF